MNLRFIIAKEYRIEKMQQKDSLHQQNIYSNKVRFIAEAVSSYI